jgi:hypothetical protein
MGAQIKLFLFNRTDGWAETSAFHEEMSGAYPIPALTFIRKFSI